MGNSNFPPARGEIDFRAIFEHAPVGIAVSADGAYELVNARYCEIFGYLPHEMIGMSYLDLVPEEDRPAVVARLEQLADLLIALGRRRRPRLV